MITTTHVCDHTTDEIMKTTYFWECEVTVVLRSFFFNQSSILKHTVTKDEEDEKKAELNIWPNQVKYKAVQSLFLTSAKSSQTSIVTVLLQYTVHFGPNFVSLSFSLSYQKPNQIR